MIKKLRKKFILLALSVVAAVITLIAVGIDVASYVNVVKDADEIIDAVESGSMAFPNGNFGQNQEEIGEEPPSEGPSGDLPNGDGPNGGRNQEFRRDGLPKEIAFSARYFIVDADENGNVLRSDLGRIAYVKSGDLDAFVGQADGERGFVGDYRYKRTETEHGYTYIFLDCEKELQSCKDFIVSGVIVTVAGLTVISLLIIFLSGKVLAPVEESYKKQKRFITDAGHELKTPLTVISANAELLELEIGEGNEWLDSIKGQTQKLAKLTKELVFLSRMDETEQAIEKTKFSLKSALEECAGGFKEAALVAGKEITPSLEEVSVVANEEMIRRAANLLLDNAVKYAEDGSILLTLRKEGKHAIFEVKNAASLEKGAHPELFERFYRPDASRNGATGGHGIGLSVVKSIAEAHGGEATCESDGKEITFRILLPLGE